MSGKAKEAFEKWKERVDVLKAEAYALYLAYQHPDVPWYAKVFAGMVVAYAFSPIDLIPDFIPIFGYLDDLILVPLGISIALKMIPADVMADCLLQAQADQEKNKPTNWAAAAVIVIIWLGSTAAGVLWLNGLFE